MSRTHAKNPKELEHEGITRLIIDSQEIFFSVALTVAGELLLGDYVDAWPLTKLLDIGGSPVAPQYTDVTEGELTSEIPPIPCHVHAGEVVNGHCKPPGKSEAYFFPPTNVPPYNLNLTGIKTRLGLKPGVTKEQVLKYLKEFGISDNLYTLLNEYQVSPWESWFIKEKAIHAPGPWPTFEIQRPQDDYNLLAWKLGETIGADQLVQVKSDHQMKSLPDEQTLMDEAIDWELNSNWDKSMWFNKCDILLQGDWGYCKQLFYHMFYGEGYVIEASKVFTRAPDVRPFAGIVWSGSGLLNGMEINCDNNERREFLVTPNNEAQFENNGSLQLIIFVVFPMKS